MRFGTTASTPWSAPSGFDEAVISSAILNQKHKAKYFKHRFTTCTSTRTKFTCMTTHVNFTNLCPPRENVQMGFNIHHPAGNGKTQFSQPK
jgi:hypothetical protein